ncbi:hypothetical protein Fmac_031051 [Flemingia macrophylla]|uniref:Uncharacterized protein n=1 Tax=Flemingia macrophylla TaxID=520843 RepID=A0ABD1L0X6_9FABA
MKGDSELNGGKLKGTKRVRKAEWRHWEQVVEALGAGNGILIFTTKHERLNMHEFMFHDRFDASGWRRRRAAASSSHRSRLDLVHVLFAHLTFFQPMPTTTPFEGGHDAWDVLYAAAGQVARMKINEASSKMDFHNRGVLGGLSPPVAAENAFFVNQGVSQVRYQVRPEQVLKQQCGGSVWGRHRKVGWVTKRHHPCSQVQNRVREFGYDYEGVKCARPLPHSVWHPLQVKHQNQQVAHFGPGLQAVSGVKRSHYSHSRVLALVEYRGGPWWVEESGELLDAFSVVVALICKLLFFPGTTDRVCSSGRLVDY